jgi:hypothetical protein
VSLTRRQVALACSRRRSSYVVAVFGGTALSTSPVIPPPPRSTPRSSGNRVGNGAPLLSAEGGEGRQPCCERAEFEELRRRRAAGRDPRRHPARRSPPHPVRAQRREDRRPHPLHRALDDLPGLSADVHRRGPRPWRPARARHPRRAPQVRRRRQRAADARGLPGGDAGARAGGAGRAARHRGVVARVVAAARGRGDEGLLQLDRHRAGQHALQSARCDRRGAARGAGVGAHPGARAA